MAEPNLKARLSRMAREATDPADREWAQSMYREEFGEALAPEHSAPGPWREGFSADSRRPVLNPLDAAIRRRAQEQEESAERDAPSFGRAAALGTAAGLTGDLFDEISASLGTYGTSPSMISAGGLPIAMLRQAEKRSDLPKGQWGGSAEYEGLREQNRQDARANAAAHPLGYYPGLIAGAIASPIKGPQIAATSALGRIGAAAVRSGVEGAAFGAGASEADLNAGDVVGTLRDTAGAGALGAGLGAAGSSVGEGIKRGGKHIADNLKRRVVGEVAEGVESATTPTQRKHLNRAQEDIWNEMTTGPDAEVIRGTRYKGATEAREDLAPIMARVGQENAEHYAKFAAAGRGNVDASDYMMRLADKAAEADEVGDTELFNAINNFISEVDSAYQRTGSLPLTRLRGMTTQTQRAAASAIGGMNGHAPAELKARLTAVATEAMDDSLSLASAGDPALEAAASAIRSNNRRYYANKTMDKALMLREPKENTGPGLLVRGAKAAATPGALAAGAAIAGDDEKKLENALLGAGAGVGLRGLVPLAKLAQRKITDMGIASQMPGYSGPSADAIARGVRPFVPPLSLNIIEAIKRRRAQEQDQ